MNPVSKEHSIFWFRRDLRLEDNVGLYHALKGRHPVIPLFIFDSEILDHLNDRRDRRVSFIWERLVHLKKQLRKCGSSILTVHGKPIEIWQKIVKEYDIKEVYTNHDYEPYANQRDSEIKKYLESQGILFKSYKDQVIFEKNDILKNDGKPYTVYTPYMKKWKEKLNSESMFNYNTEKLFSNFVQKQNFEIIPLEEINFKKTDHQWPPIEIDEDLIKKYHQTRNFPGIKGTTRISVHLRFGTVSIRKLVRTVLKLNETWLNELIWREFFMMILYHFPHVVENPFKSNYQKIKWINDEKNFSKWCTGMTGYPIVDAGMRELNKTGFMHNRVRMITANFLTKLLLTDWRWGEQYFAKKLLDYELTSNNGNWQWAAGCGCDAAPYFRIFNPESQISKFDPDLKYINRWIPELNSEEYPKPIEDYKFARERALAVYEHSLKS
jgi:deoxyribodipyrimidine photo-lyase